MRVFIVDSHPVFREGLKNILNNSRELTVIGESDSCRDLLHKVLQRCDVITVDGELESLDFLQSLEKSRAANRPPFTLVLTRHTENQHAIQMLAAGAGGYVNKTETPEVILAAIRKVGLGRKYVSGELMETLLYESDPTKRARRLSTREYQFLYLFASGLGMKEIAGQLCLSVKTISTYRSRLLEKLNLKSNAQLMSYAFKEGVLSDQWGRTHERHVDRAIV